MSSDTRSNVSGSSGPLTFISSAIRSGPMVSRNRLGTGSPCSPLAGVAPAWKLTSTSFGAPATPCPTAAGRAPRPAPVVDLHGQFGQRFSVPRRIDPGLGRVVRHIPAID